jgi:neurotransmitter:Na+ symporter, NSS family
MADSPDRNPHGEHWKSRLGAILAVAGSAIGLGNFLRFPGLSAQYGGGAFMIAYFCAFLFLGLPICWVEWSMGRRAGRHGLHGAPFMLVALTKKTGARYLGVLFLLVPLGISLYYFCIEAWCLGYAVNFATGGIHFETSADSGGFFSSFVGLSGNGSALTLGIAKAGIYLAACFFLNFLLIYKGVSRGIEKFCLYATPALLVIALVVLVRVLTLGTPDPAKPHNNINTGLGYMWNPDKVMLERMVNVGPTAKWVSEKELVGADVILQERKYIRKDRLHRVREVGIVEQLENPQMWMSAASQIFFTLSIGFCLILNYASYLRRKQDIVLNALSAAGANEFAEVALGGMITVPAGVAFLGVAGVAGAGTFGLGFNVLPMVFSMMPGGSFFGFLFFSLLFIAALTSSISMIQPTIAFFEETMTVARKQSVAILGLLTVVGSTFVAYFSGGLKAMDTLDFWFGTCFLFVVATTQMVIFSWVIGADTVIEEMKRGAYFLPPIKLTRFVIRWISPLFLIAVGCTWAYYELFNFDGGQPSAYVKNLFIQPDNVAVMCVLFMILSGIMFAMLLKPRAFFENLVKLSEKAEKEEK